MHILKINIQLPQGIAEGGMRNVKPILIGVCFILAYGLRSVIKMMQTSETIGIVWPPPLSSGSGCSVVDCRLAGRYTVYLGR
jgi:hypothetical protein